MPEKNPAELVKAIREAMGLTQEQFAAQFGVTVATVNRWENGRGKPSPLALKQIEALRKKTVMQTAHKEEQP